MIGASISNEEYGVLSRIQRRNHTDDSFYIHDRHGKVVWKDLDNNTFVCFRTGLQWFKDALLEQDIVPNEWTILDNLFKRFKIK